MSALRDRVHEILEPAGKGDRISRGVDWLILSLIGLDLGCLVAGSVPEIQEGFAPIHDTVVYGVLAVFAIEYALRLWSCTSDERYAHPISGRLSYAVTPFAIVDLLAIVPVGVLLIHLFSGQPDAPVELASVRAFRFLRFARLLKVARYSSSVNVLARSLWRIRSEIGVLLLAEVLVVVVSSVLMWAAERDVAGGPFSSIPAAMWWSIVTLTTVGYGDFVPATAAGRVIGTVVMICGVGLFAVPTGMIGAAFVDGMNEERDRKRKVREEREKRAEELREEKYGVPEKSVVCPHCKEAFDLYAARADD